MEKKAAMVDMRSDTTWSSQLADKISSIGSKSKEAGDVLDGEEQGYDAADAMEAGQVRFTSILAMQPAAVEQRLVVIRSREQLVSTLQNAAGEVLLMSKAAADGNRFDIYLSRDGAPPLVSRSFFGKGAPVEPQPSFTLMASDSERNQWALASLQCERCASHGRRRCGTSQVMCVRHYLEPVGAGQAFCMDVFFPAKQDRGVQCEICGTCSGAEAAWTQALTSRRPKWNIKNKSLSLDFRGRAKLASAKNFQLENASLSQKAFLLYGKVSEDKFVLDYSSPMGMVQAFAAALSVAHWQ